MRVPDSLPSCVYLLAYDREREALTQRNWLGYLVVAAAYADLWASGHIVDNGGKVAVPAGAKPPVDPILRAVWTDAADKSRRWEALVRRNTREAENAVAARLDEAGAIRVLRDTTRWRRSRIDIRNPLALTRLNDRVAALLRRPQPFERGPRRDAALVGLLAVADVRTAISKQQRRDYADRIAAAIVAGGPAVAGLKRAITHAKSSLS